MFKSMFKTTVAVIVLTVFVSQNAFAFFSGARSVTQATFINIGKKPISLPSYEVKPWWSNAKRVSTCDDFNAVRQNVNADYLVVKDIDCQGVTLAPIGTSEKPFTGHFEADGEHIIHNFIIDNATYGLDNIFNASTTATFAGLTFVNVRLKNHTFEEEKITTNNPTIPQGLGAAVSVDQQTLAVGAPYESSEGVSGGAVYLYAFNDDQWVVQATIKPIVPQQDAQFGKYVHLKGNVLVVGANGEKEDKVFVFEFSNNQWQQTTVIPVKTGSLACIASHNIVVANRDGFDVYVKVNTSWVNTQRVSVTESKTSLSKYLDFGVSLAGSDELLVIGATSNNLIPNMSGSVYIYALNKGQWALTGLVSNDTPGFGSAVAVDGQNIAIRSNTNIFTTRLDRLVWKGARAIFNKSDTAGYEFGQGLALRQGVLAISLVPQAINPGSAVPKETIAIFQQREDKYWYKIADTVASDFLPAWQEGNLQLNSYAQALAINDENQIFAGSPEALVGENNNGAVYVYTLREPKPAALFADLSIALKSGNAVVGESTSLTSTITNQGKALAPATVLKIRTVKQGPTDTATSVQSIAVSALKPGESVEINVAHIFTEPGTYAVEAIIDEANLIKEENKVNNKANLSVVVEISIDQFKNTITTALNGDTSLQGIKNALRAAINNVIDYDEEIQHAFDVLMGKAFDLIKDDISLIAAINKYLDQLYQEIFSDAAYQSLQDRMFEELEQLKANDPRLIVDPYLASLAVATILESHKQEVQDILTRLVVTNSRLKALNPSISKALGVAFTKIKPTIQPDIDAFDALVDAKVSASGDVRILMQALGVALTNNVANTLGISANDSRLLAQVNDAVLGFVKAAIDTNENIAQLHDLFNGVLSEYLLNSFLLTFGMVDFYKFSEPAPQAAGLRVAQALSVQSNSVPNDPSNWFSNRVWLPIKNRFIGVIVVQQTLIFPVSNTPTPRVAYSWPKKTEIKP